MATIAVASDHAGLNLRRAIVEHIVEHIEAAHTVRDLGPHSSDSVDYPDFAVQVSQLVAAGEVDLGILVCGTGIGMSMAANRHRGVRAALCFNEFMARATRAHNNANVLCLGERVVGLGTALGVVDAFLGTEFEGGRHGRRVDKIEAIVASR